MDTPIVHIMDATSPQRKPLINGSTEFASGLGTLYDPTIRRAICRGCRKDKCARHSAIKCHGVKSTDASGMKAHLEKSAVALPTYETRLVRSPRIHCALRASVHAKQY